MKRQIANTGLSVKNLMAALASVAIPLLLYSLYYSIQKKIDFSKLRGTAIGIICKIETYRIVNGDYPSRLNEIGVSEKGWEYKSNGEKVSLLNLFHPAVDRGYLILYGKGGEIGEFNLVHEEWVPIEISQ